MNLEVAIGFPGLWEQLPGARTRCLRRPKCTRLLSPPGALIPNCETRTNRCLQRGGLVLPGCCLNHCLVLALRLGTERELAIIALIFQKKKNPWIVFPLSFPSPFVLCSLRPWVLEEILPSAAATTPSAKCGGM